MTMRSEQHHKSAVKRLRIDGRRRALAARLASLCAATLLAPAFALGSPEVSVKDVSMQAIDREHLRLNVILKMDNSNPLPIPLSSIQFLARIEDREVATGQTTESLRLPALGSADASFRVLIPLRALPVALDRGLGAFLGDGLRYEIEGTAELGGVFRIPFRKNGRFTRAQLLAAIRS
ncbi:MAG: hypothetical protein EBW05_13345 [Betaproteobacteria bacterium]|nr:hypothetical protein [Betaproteobacteria bacterium]